MLKNTIKLLLFLSMANPSRAQTLKDNLQKIAKDPKTTERAAKADVLLHDKKIISSSPVVDTTAIATKKFKKKRRK